MTAVAEPAHLLIVDDDDRLRALLKRFLIRQGFWVTAAGDAATARRLLAGIAFDLIVLDVMMPGEDGLSLVRALRAAGHNVPVILLTARGEPRDRIAGLEAGADDYLPKPFEPRELVLRINAILRRSPPPAPPAAIAPVLRLGRLRFDPATGALYDNDEPVHLTQTEAALLKILAATPGAVVRRERIIALLGRERTPTAGTTSRPSAQQTVGPEGQGGAPAPALPHAGGENEADDSARHDRAIDVQITRLRRKIEPDPREPRYLLTVRGEGYRLVADPT